MATGAGGPKFSGLSSLELVGRNWHAVTEGREDGQGPSPGDRMTVFGEVADSAGEKLGDFYASCFCLNAPFDESSRVAMNVEMHTIRLSDGTIHGMGTSAAGPDEEVEFAIVGGTGRFRGARGTYVAQQAPVEHGGDGSARFKLTFGT